MTLSDYIEQRGSAAKRDLAKKTGLRWATIHDIARGAAQPKPDTAKAIEDATGGEVTAIELLGLAPAPAPATAAEPVAGLAPTDSDDAAA